MNRKRRKDLEGVKAALEEAKERLEFIGEEEQEYYDNMPEGIQEGIKGDAAQEAIDAIDAAVYGIDDVLSSIDEAIEGN